MRLLADEHLLNSRHSSSAAWRSLVLVELFFKLIDLLPVGMVIYVN